MIASSFQRTTPFLKTSYCNEFFGKRERHVRQRDKRILPIASLCLNCADNVHFVKRHGTRRPKEHFKNLEKGNSFFALTCNSRPSAILVSPLFD